MDSYDIIAAKVREYWESTYPQDVIAFFYQKYSFESDSDWEWCEELVYPNGSDDYKTVHFANDFCEGQKDVKDVSIVPLEEIIKFYHEKSNKQTIEAKALSVINAVVPKFRELADKYVSRKTAYGRCRGLAYVTAADIIESMMEDDDLSLT